MSLDIKELDLFYKVQGVDIGRTIIFDDKETNPNSPSNFMQNYKNPDFPNRLQFAMHNNSPQKYLPVENIASAYFTYNPKVEAVIIEWGKIDPNGNLKLHTYLNQVIDSIKRYKVGLTIRSGHIAKIKGQATQLALLDSLIGDENYSIPKISPEHQIVKILSEHNFVVITSNGYLCNHEL